MIAREVMRRSPRWLLAIGVTWFGLGIALAWAGPSEKVARLHDEVLAHTVRIDDRCSGTLFWSHRDHKSGEVETLVLTAAHCARDMGETLYEVDVPARNGQNRLVGVTTYYARFAGKSYGADLAVLRFKDTDTYISTVAAIAAEDVEIYVGDEVVTVGYPGGEDITLTRGTLGPLAEMTILGEGLREYLRATPAIIGGNSGGGMYLDIDGKWSLIGVAVAGRRDAAHVGLYVPIAEVFKLLRRVAPEAVGKVKGSRPGGG